MDEKTEEKIDDAVDKLTVVATDLITGAAGIFFNFFNKEEADAQEASASKDGVENSQRDS